MSVLTATAREIIGNDCAIAMIAQKTMKITFIWPAMLGPDVIDAISQRKVL
jgi:hypothetical protein